MSTALRVDKLLLCRRIWPLEVMAAAYCSIGGGKKKEELSLAVRTLSSDLRDLTFAGKWVGQERY